MTVLFSGLVLSADIKSRSVVVMQKDRDRRKKRLGAVFVDIFTIERALPASNLTSAPFSFIWALTPDS